MTPAEDEIEEERKRAAEFFRGSGKAATDERRAAQLTAPRPKQGSVRPPSAVKPSTALERRVASTRVRATLRVLIVVALLFSLWQGYLWWAQTEPKPLLAESELSRTHGGYLVVFAVTNEGGPGTIQMTAQLVLRDGKTIDASPIPKERSRFRAGETKHFRTVIPLPEGPEPVACRVKLGPSSRTLR